MKYHNSFWLRAQIWKYFQKQCDISLLNIDITWKIKDNFVYISSKYESFKLADCSNNKRLNDWVYFVLQKFYRMKIKITLETLKTRIHRLNVAAWWQMST